MVSEINLNSEHAFYKRIINFIVVVFNYLSFSWRFYSFGWKSRIGKVDILTNSKAISIGKKVTIRKRARLEAIGPWDKKNPKMSIGDGTVIHLYFHCGAAESVTIGKDVLIAGHVYITDHEHTFDLPDIPTIKSKTLITSPVIIEDGVWLGQGCVILKGVTIGKRSVVGANAVVTKDVPPFTVVAGVPAHVIKNFR